MTFREEMPEPPVRPLSVWIGRFGLLLEGAQARGVTVRQLLETAADNWPPGSKYRPLSGHAAIRRLYADVQAAYVRNSTSWLAGVPPMKLAELEPVEELHPASTAEVERLEMIPHRPTDTGALPPVSLPRAPQPARTHNRVCSAKRTRGPLEEVHHR